MDVETYFTTFFVLVGLPMAVAIAAFILAAVVYLLSFIAALFLISAKNTLTKESDVNG